MRRFIFFFQLLFAFYVVYGQETGTITDSRDGQTYNIVKIGNQWWMAENLAYLLSVSPSSSESYTHPYYYVTKLSNSSPKSRAKSPHILF